MVLYFSKPLNHRRSFIRNQLGKELTGLHCQSTSDSADSSNLLLDSRLNLPSHPSFLLTSPQTISISVVMAIIQLNLKIMFTSLFSKHLRFKAFVHQSKGFGGVFECFSNGIVFITNPIILFLECTIISSLELCLQEETMEKEN